MSNPRVITWLPVDKVLIAPPQVLAVAGKLSLNSSVPGQPQGAFIYDGVIRQITINAGVNDLSGVDFTVTGIGSPINAEKNPTQTLGLITETITGPAAAASVLSDNIYSQIISITTDDAADDVSVGSGPNGITSYVFLDYNRSIFQTSAQIQFLGRVDAEVTVFVSLTKPQVIDINAGNLINIQPIPAFKVDGLTAATEDALGAIQFPAAITWAAISKETTDDTIIFTVLQQGTCS